MDNYRDQYVENAIASIPTLQRYMTEDAGKKYPLDLDVAYPLFRQTRLLTGHRSYSVLAPVNYGIGRHTLSSDTIIDDVSMTKGDVVRVDGVTATTLTEMHEWNMNVIPVARYRGVALFSLDTTEIRRLGIESLRQVLE